MFRFLDRFEANLRDTVLIYSNDAGADRILVLGIDRPQLIILAGSGAGRLLMRMTPL